MSYYSNYFPAQSRFDDAANDSFERKSTRRRLHKLGSEELHSPLKHNAVQEKLPSPKNNSNSIPKVNPEIFVHIGSIYESSFSLLRDTENLSSVGTVDFIVRQYFASLYPERRLFRQQYSSFQHLLAIHQDHQQVHIFSKFLTGQYPFKAFVFFVHVYAFARGSFSQIVSLSGLSNEAPSLSKHATGPLLSFQRFLGTPLSFVGALELGMAVLRPAPASSATSISGAGSAFSPASPSYKISRLVDCRGSQRISGEGVNDWYDYLLLSTEAEAANRSLRGPFHSPTHSPSSRSPFVPHNKRAVTGDGFLIAMLAFFLKQHSGADAAAVLYPTTPSPTKRSLAARNHSRSDFSGSSQPPSPYHRPVSERREYGTAGQHPGKGQQGSVVGDSEENAFGLTQEEAQGLSLSRLALSLGIGEPTTTPTHTASSPSPLRPSLEANDEALDGNETDDSLSEYGAQVEQAIRQRLGGEGEREGERGASIYQSEMGMEELERKEEEKEGEGEEGEGSDYHPLSSSPAPSVADTPEHHEDWPQIQRPAEPARSLEAIAARMEEDMAESSLVLAQLEEWVAALL